MDSVKIRTVLGEKNVSKSTVTLAHEHICCYSEYLYAMSRNYLDKNELADRATEQLKRMKEKYNLGLFADCTPVNIGRDVEMLKKISERSGVDIICSGGFYYNDEPVLYCTPAERLAEYIVEDIHTAGAGIIKAAVESDELTDFNVKVLKAAAIAQKETGLPVVLHTNAVNKNGEKALKLLLCENVNPERITVGHLSDTADCEYIKKIASTGCYIALDRMYGDTSERYALEKANQIKALCDAGYEDKILLSHDDAVFQGFEAEPKMKEPRWGYIFEYIAPALGKEVFKKMTEENPVAAFRTES